MILFFGFFFFELFQKFALPKKTPLVLCKQEFNRENGSEREGKSISPRSEQPFSHFVSFTPYCEMHFHSLYSMLSKLN